ncbi:MAG: hypothetical protein H0Z33_11180 [Bacillaceae bacterium]|nr:hypothetical protein [Bacillaceae bacterium]
MKMKRKSTLFLMLGIVLAAVVAFQYQAMVENVKQEAYVVVAKEEIKPYTKIEKDMLDIQRRPVRSIQEGTYTSVEDVMGKYSFSHLLPGDMIRTGHIIEENATLTGLLHSLRDGSLIGIAVPLSQTDVGPQIQPGDFIHLLGLITMPNNVIDSKYVAEYVPVLAKKDGSNGESRVYLAVPKKDFPDIGKAIEAGRIRAAIAQKHYQEIEKEMEQELNLRSKVQQTEEEEESSEKGGEQNE